MNNDEYTYRKDLLTHYEQTLKEMKRLSLQYWKNLLDLNKFNFDFFNSNLKQTHDFIKDKLQYISDPNGLEHLTRPKVITS